MGKEKSTLGLLLELYQPKGSKYPAVTSPTLLHWWCTNRVIAIMRICIGGSYR